MALRTSTEKLLNAIDQCQLSKIINLVDQGHNIHVKNTFEQNFLVHILQQQQQQQKDPLLSKKRFHIFQFLITHYNLDMHSFDYYGKNLFNWATNLNCTEEALYLLNSYPGDIDILARDRSGSCSLHYTVEHGNEILVHAIVNYLLRYRLRFDIKDAHDNTPEDIANKLGYGKIADFLRQACQSTVFLSREIPYKQQRPLTNKSRVTMHTNSSLTSSWLVDSSEYFHIIESKVNVAKSLNDWKTVAALRAPKKNAKKISYPSRRTNTKASSIPTLPKLPPNQFVSQSEQMLHLVETQLSSSFRPSFTPIYQRTNDSNMHSQRNKQRKMSQASSRRMSSVQSQRKRDSGCSQSSICILPEVQNRLSVPPAYKQYRQSFVATN